MTPEVPAETVENAVNTFFTAGLPENILNQIKEAIKPEVVNVAEDEAVVAMEERLGKIEESIANKAGGARPRGTSTNQNAEDKFDVDGVGWSETK